MKKILFLSLLLSVKCLGAGLVNGTLSPFPSSFGNTLIVSPSGPYSTPSSAVAAAQAGDTVVIYPGTYTNQNNLGKDYVNLYCFPGVTNIYVEQSTNGVGVNPGYGFIDDRSGPLHVSVYGHGTWIYSCGTNWQNYDATNLFIYVDNPNTLGAVVLTNFGSTLNWESDDVYMGDIDVNGGWPFFQLKTSKYHNIKIRDAYDLYFTNGVNLTVPGFATNFNVVSTPTFWYWGGSGESHLKFTHVHPFLDYNAFWWDEAATTTHTNYEGECWIDGDLSETYFYCSGKSSTWRTWWNVREVKLFKNAQTLASACWTFLGPGKHYVNNLKSESTGLSLPCLLTENTTNVNDLQVWFTSQALKNDMQWIVCNAGTLYANVNHFDDTGANGGTVDQGIEVTPHTGTNAPGSIRLTGQIVQANNGRPFALYDGTNVFQGIEIRSTNNSCAYVTNGYNLFNGCLMISKTGSNSINSGPFTVNVGLIGGAQNTAKSANVTVSPGTAVVDTNLK